MRHAVDGSSFRLPGSLALVSVLALGLAACSGESRRFSSGEGWGQGGAQSAWNAHQNQVAGRSWQGAASEVTGSVQRAPQPGVSSQPLPPISSAPAPRRPIAPPPTPISSDVTPLPPPQAPAPVMTQAQPQPRMVLQRGPQPVAAAPAVPVVSQPTASGTTVVVQDGQSLYGIARRNGVSATELMRANGITDANRIQVGQRLVIPGNGQRVAAQPQPAPAAPQPVQPVQPVAQAPAPVPGRHTIRTGETLAGIARATRMTERDLREANAMSPSAQLRVGQEIVIPNAEHLARIREARRQPAADPTPTGSVTATERPARPQAQPVQAAAPTQRTQDSDANDAQRLAARAQATPPTPAPERQVQSATEFRWPVRGRVVSGFGPKAGGGQNDGINIAVPAGTPIRASENGVVIYAGNELRGFGNLVLIRHEGDWVTAYAHKQDISVRRGDVVRRGQVIGRAGQTGNVSQPQLHFEIRRGSTPVDPTQFLTGA